MSEGGNRQAKHSKVSMMDIDIFRAISAVMSTAHDARSKIESRGREQGHDEFGDVHIILFGDFKCLPYFSSM